ncbi:Helix-turn-helix domain protein [Maioricimonas rarisocia]|uniref:Helix-turn-helix domain protein n=1 Tax=Maioricimonas rarisocia TaxID=2528026 RepID=A0A517ZE65_9PLAN|nr:helix-turn-helix transcriptional regulator [Maioricimonas rarisocia]QDU40767.1 Helix-turn-helix domain protein [Maioricimonas rarisocia]
MGRTTQAVVATVEAECRRRGWNIAELERKAGIVRGTFYRMRRGETENPRRKTLKKIADALEMEVDDLLRGEAADPERMSGRFGSVRSGEQRAFDRATNPVVEAVARDRPRLFADWSSDDWDELYSTFGTGGELNSQGVQVAAEAINRKRDTVHRLHVVMETHLRDVAIEMVDALFRMVEAKRDRMSADVLSGLKSPSDDSPGSR